LVFFKFAGQVDEGRADGRAGRERGDVGFAGWVGEGDTTAVVDLACRGGTYAPQVGAGGTAASAGPLVAGPGLASVFFDGGPPPSVTNPVITRAATTVATIPTPRP
jgi:hypothetical protein